MADSTISTAEHTRLWWKEAVIYQIYPSTFHDSNGDGIGDIRGIIPKLPHIKSLGADAIWLSPHYQSPQVDMGYDISDYEAIHPPYGTLADCQALIDECHAIGLKIIFDLVINHTSSQHAWFQESRSSKTDPKRDWYFWRPPRYDEQGNRQPPNNWRSQFSVPAWTYDATTEEYYLHLYASEMPDLNWENVATREALYETSMHFWLRRGLDGFRIDVVNKYSKDISFPDAEITDPDSISQPAMQYYTNGPRIHEFLSEMHEILSQYRTFDGQPIMTVGELPNTPDVADVLAYVSASQKQLDMVFNFDTVSLGQKLGDRLIPVPFTHTDFINKLSLWQEFISNPSHTDAWTTVFLENHDQGRSISRFGNDTSELLRDRSGKMLATLLATMSGMLFLYQGQEIGMTNIPAEWGVEEYKDVRSINFIADLRAKGAGEARIRDALAGMHVVARDNARLPMQWDGSFHAGFTADENAAPWMRVHPNHESVNVEKQERDRDSSLWFWRRMLALRKDQVDLFVYGDYELLSSTERRDGNQHDDKFHGSVMCFRKTERCRGGEGREAVVVANLSNRTLPWTFPAAAKRENRLERSKSLEWKLEVCNVERQESDVDGKEVSQLMPYEARVYVQRLKEKR